MSGEQKSMGELGTTPNTNPMRAIVFKLDYNGKKAFVRIMIDQDQGDFPLENYKPIDINHLYVPFDFIGNGETDIELGSIIECERNYLTIVGPVYGTNSGLVGLPRNVDRLKWDNLAMRTLLYGELIKLPMFYDLFVNKEHTMEIYFDHKARTESISSKKQPSSFPILLTRIRFPTIIEIEGIIEYSKIYKNGNSELAEITLIRMFANDEKPDIPKYLKIMAENKFYELKETIEIYLIEISNSRKLCELVDLLDMANRYYLDKVSMHIDDWLVDIYAENIDDTECKNEIIFYCLEATQHCYLPEILDELEKFFTSMLSESLETLENSYKSLVGIEIWDSSLSEKVSVAAEFENRIAGFVGYMFDKVEKSHVNLVRFLNFAQTSNIITLKDLVSDYLLANLHHTHWFENVQLAFDFKLKKFRDDAVVLLGDSDLCERKEFILRKLIRLFPQ